MDLVASFSSQRVNTFNFFFVRGIFGDNNLLFLFDTGAACSVVGINSFFREGRETIEKRKTLEELLKDEIKNKDVLPRNLKAANNQSVTTYPCICRSVSIENTSERDFYFDISFEDISIPLLGSSFIDDCAYNHAINGNINITGIKEKAGSGYYDECTLIEFDEIARKYAMKVRRV